MACVSRCEGGGSREQLGLLCNERADQACVVLDDRAEECLLDRHEVVRIVNRRQLRKLLLHLNLHLRRLHLLVLCLLVLCLCRLRRGLLLGGKLARRSIRIHARRKPRPTNR